jgi:hypothetical protein
MVRTSGRTHQTTLRQISKLTAATAKLRFHGRSQLPELVEKAFIARANCPEEAIIIEPAGSV